jgi:hypothetical protein
MEAVLVTLREMDCAGLARRSSARLVNVVDAAARIVRPSLLTMNLEETMQEYAMRR